MKSFFLALAAICTLALSAQPAKALSFHRDPLSLISFRAQSNAKVVIRNSEGKIVRTKNCYGNTCNVESTSLQPGSYTYTIISGNSSSAGAFSVK
jgi:hypothetical protein